MYIDVQFHYNVMIFTPGNKEIRTFLSMNHEVNIFRFWFLDEKYFRTISVYIHNCLFFPLYKHTHYVKGLHLLQWTKLDVLHKLNFNGEFPVSIVWNVQKSTNLKSLKFNQNTEMLKRYFKIFSYLLVDTVSAVPLYPYLHMVINPGYSRATGVCGIDICATPPKKSSVVCLSVWS
jgi:hypothetical protein